MLKSSSSWDKVVRYISFRPRTEWEVRKYLGLECTEELMARLRELNFINDDEYAKNYVEVRNRRSPRSRKLLSLELARRGIKAGAIEGDDAVLATEALRRKAKSWVGVPRLDFMIKARRFLVSRGFGGEMIEKTLRNGYNENYVK